MKRDRRIEHRTGLDRRRSDRIAEYRPVVWLAANRHHLGWLVDHSADGLAMIVESDNAPPRHAAISVAVHRGSDRKLDTCRVVRLEEKSPALRLVTAEYVSRAEDRLSQGIQRDVAASFGRAEITYALPGSTPVAEIRA
jgi:hypothetical protein